MPPERKFTVQKDNHWTFSAVLSVDYVHQVIGGEALQMGCTQARQHIQSGMMQALEYFLVFLVHDNGIRHYNAEDSMFMT